MIHIYEPFIARNQKKYVVDALDDNMLTFHGKYTKLFEQSIADRFNFKHCIATTSGTTALFTCYRILKYGKEKPLALTSSMSYAATISQLLLAGYEVKFIDFADNLQIDLECLEKSLDYLLRYERRTPDLLVLPTVYGNMPDMKKVVELCNKYHVTLLEDSAESFGCSQYEKYSGSFGVAGCFSFFGNKIITCGEGGAIVTNDDEFARLCRSFINQGVMTGYYHDSVGSNFRLTNIQAAIGYAQMQQYDQIIYRKKQIADYYRFALDNKYKAIVPNCESTEWMQVFKLPEHIKYNGFADYMMSKGIETRPIFRPLNKMAAFWGVSTCMPKGGGLEFEKSHFILPASPNLTDAELVQIVEAANNYE